jgi:hypothetical protein
LYLELSFKILKIILRFNFKLHFEPEATLIRVKSEKRRVKRGLTPNPWTPPAPLRGERWGEGSSIKDFKDL